MASRSYIFRVWFELLLIKWFQSFTLSICLNILAILLYCPAIVYWMSIALKDVTKMSSEKEKLICRLRWTFDSFATEKWKKRKEKKCRLSNHFISSLSSKKCYTNFSSSSWKRRKRPPLHLHHLQPLSMSNPLLTCWASGKKKSHICSRNKVLQKDSFDQKETIFIQCVLTDMDISLERQRLMRHLHEHFPFGWGVTWPELSTPNVAITLKCLLKKRKVQEITTNLVLCMVIYFFHHLLILSILQHFL